MKFASLAPQETITKTVSALQNNGMTVTVVGSAHEAKDAVLALIPSGSEVMTMTSISLDDAGISEAINGKESNYVSAKNKLWSLNRETQGKEMQQIGATSDWTIGSVHAITERGEVIVTSNTGSQLPAYAYGSAHVIWVVGTQKIVKDIAEGMQRITDYIVPKESIRAREAYGLPADFQSNPSKTLIINREITPGRVHIILVNEVLGF